MPDFGSATFSQTDASNNSGTMPSWSGSAAPSTLDDAGRALQGAVTREWNWRNYTLTSTGTGTALVLTYSVAPAAYYNGQRFAFITNTAVTGSCTLAINGLAATTIKKNLGGTLTNLASGDVPAGTYLEVEYNLAGTAFVIVNGILPFVSDSSGNIGVGIAPAGGYKLYANGSIGATDGTVTAFLAPVAGGNAAILGTSTNHSVVFYQNNAEAFRVDTNKNVLVTSSGGLGYGTGSGGAVTQITSKGTNVTLNKTNGAITTNNSALGAGATATFTVFSTSMASTDTVILNVTNGNYSVRVFNNAAGSFAIALKNETAGSLSDAVQINFAIIKAVTS